MKPLQLTHRQYELLKSIIEQDSIIHDFSEKYKIHKNVVYVHLKKSLRTREYAFIDVEWMNYLRTLYIEHLKINKQQYESYRRTI